jgi:CHAT domain-containing protein/Tfp pilus assembly protein PilF
LNQEFVTLFQAGRYQEALALEERALEIFEKTRGPEHPDTLAILSNLGGVYRITGAYERALPLLQRALQAREKVLGPEHPDTAASLNNLGLLYYAMGRYHQALPLHRRALEIREKVRGPEHADTANSLNNLAALFQALGDYRQALPLYRRVLQIRERGCGPEHPLVAVSLHNLAAVHEYLAEYAQALPLYEGALKLREKALGPEHPETAGALDHLASLLVAMGTYDKALPLLQRALAIKEQVLGPEHPETAVTLNNLAVYYQTRGDYRQALPLSRRALAIKEKALGPEHPQTATSLNNLAGVYLELGAAAQALPLYRRALEITEKTLGPEHPQTAVCLNNLAVQHRVLGEYDQALPLYLRALEIREKSLGPEHPDLAAGLNNLALLYMVTGAVAEALPLCQRSLKIVEKSLGPGHAYNLALNNLGSLYLVSKDYETAAAYFRQSRHLPGLTEAALARGQPEEALKLLQEQSLTWRDPPLKQAQHQTQTGAALAGVGRLKDAALALRRAVAGVEDLRRLAPGEREGFFRAGIPGGLVRPYRGLVAALAEMSLKNEALPPDLREYGPEAKDAAFFFAEGAKARVLLEAMAQAAQRQSRAGIPEEWRRREEGLLQRLAALDKQWDQALEGGEEAGKEARAGKERLNLELKALVKELRRKYPVYAALHYPQPLPGADLPLQDNETLLEFALTDAAGYVFVVRRGGVKDLVKIPLGREELEAKVKAFMEPLVNRRPHDFSLEQARELYSLLLAGALKDVKESGRVIIVPDGVLGLLPFEALALKAGEGLKDSVFVGDRYSLSYYQSAAVLALKRTLKEERAGRLLFALGNPVFSPQDPRWTPGAGGEKTAAPAVRGKGQAAFKTLAAREEWGRTRSGGQGQELTYDPLPETEEEVRAIAGLLGVKAAPPDVLLNLQANETSLKKSPLQEYRYLHFATHADFPGQVQGIQEPFILLGQVGNEGRDNGFLTLGKVLGLKLRADLVVLSACLTGRGQVMEGEGVANFSRAFQHAGARSVVVSLWEVPSLEAVEGMILFYRHHKEGKPRSQALNLARRAIRAKYPQPFYWAVFILHGEG